jgi:phosphoribosylformimino-5-aminoimidazole carboxamide ribotide isomerase
MRIYPAVDIKGGRAVRLSQGKLDRETAYYDDPTVPAKLWAAAGAEWIHVVDLDGAFTGKPCNCAAVGAIAATGIRVELGGGMRTEDDISRAFDAGVSRVVIGTKAVEDNSFVEKLVAKFGEKIAVGIDAKNGKVAVRGWVDTSEVSAVTLAKTVAKLGVKTVIYTDISRDGMLIGPNFDAQREMLGAAGCNIIASGGVGSLADIEKFARIAREFDNLDGVIIGKALYEGKVDLAKAIAAAQ